LILESSVAGKAAAGAVMDTLSLLNAFAAAMQANFILDEDRAGVFGLPGTTS
jgi:hypothetical protein